MNFVESKRCGEHYETLEHPSGLRICVLPKPDFSKTYVIFATRFGSVNAGFETAEGKEMTVPAGTAHFLEHKLFESEGGDAFSLFAKTGANANAFTSFDTTAYLFSCTDETEASLEILLNMVRTPYFTAESVEKEQGIIGQEIGMYDDDPSWQGLMLLFGLLYHTNTVKIDIAGTTRSIGEITPEKLYACYENFYALSNMTLCVCGNTTMEAVRRVADRCLKADTKKAGSPRFPKEPAAIVAPYGEKTMSVAVPLYAIGLKDNETEVYGRSFTRKKLLFELCLELLCGEDSGFYKEYYAKGTLNGSFSKGYDGGATYSLCLFTGEGKNPKAVFEALLQEMERLKSAGFSEKQFANCKKVLYGNEISQYNHVEAIANRMVSCYFMKEELFDAVSLFEEVTLEETERFFREHFRRELCALSVISGKK